VLDGTDDFDTRYLVNRACVAAGVPLISGALTQWEGQLGLYDPSRGGPCYACVFPVQPAAGLVPACAEAGVAAPLPGIIGAMMAMEAVKFLTGAGKPLLGRLMIHDALFAETRVITTRRDPGCPVCGRIAAARVSAGAEGDLPD
jgi:molybdopterin/thiamine biosynthesis adenylyltransferase